MDTRSDTPAALSREELARYGRHLVLPEVGLDGQRSLREAKVLVVGAGGLGSPLALYLAAAGVGTIGLVDFDTVELSNLQRQVLYGTGDVGRPKLEAARERLEGVNPHVRVETHAVRLSAANALEILTPYDVVADGTDNFPTRYLVNDACVLLRKPNVYGSIFRFEGQVAVFWAGRGPCYRCLFPEPPPPGAVPDCATGGVLGVLPGIIGSLQAAEVLKLILERGEPLCGRLMLFDALEMRFRELQLRRDPRCAMCGDEPTVRELVEYGASCAPARPTAEGAGADITATELHERMSRGETPLLLDVRTPGEWSVCRLAGARLIPIQELDTRLDELDRDREIVVYCHVGGRSAMAVDLLQRSGFTAARNLVGGIEAWAASVDPSMPRY